MPTHSIKPVWIAGVALFACACFGQGETQLRVRQLPGWDPRAREGRCEVRVWVDNRAEVRMRGDGVFVRTLEGSRGHDEGSQCTQPLPYNFVRNFQVRQTAGRNRVSVTQEPNRMNNFTAMIAIEDRQGGGDNYAFDVTWQSENTTGNVPAPFFDEVRACQDAVRDRFSRQNGRGSYIDFDNFADRQIQDQGRGKGKNRGRIQETIQGRGNARNYNESRDLTYSCVIDTQRAQVVAGNYQLAGAGLRTNGPNRLK